MTRRIFLLYWFTPLAAFVLAMPWAIKVLFWYFTWVTAL